MAEPFVLSASSVSTYLRCGHQWLLAYVVAVKSPPSLKAVRGIAVHRAVEHNMVQKINSTTDLPLDEVLDAYDTSWNDETADGFNPIEGDASPGEIKDAGVKLVRIYQREVAPKIQPDIVEEPVRFKINGRDFTGQIDLGQMIPINLHGEPEYAMEIRDTKTTGRRPDPSAYLLNMTGYAISSRQATGQPEADTVFDYLVATQKPYYHELRLGGPVSDSDIRRFSKIVGSVSDGIEKGNFAPNGLQTGACRWCGFTAICPYYKEVG